MLPYCLHCRAYKKGPKPESRNCEISLRRIIGRITIARFHAKVVNFVKKGPFQTDFLWAALKGHKNRVAV